MKITFIEWKDAWSKDEWTGRNDIDTESQTVYSAGILITESDDVVLLAVNFDKDNDMYSCVMAIPKQMIVKRSEMDLL